MVYNSIIVHSVFKWICTISLIESFIGSSSDSDTEDQKTGVEGGTSNATGTRAYYYQHSGGKHALADPHNDKDISQRENEIVTHSRYEDTSTPITTITLVQKPGSIISTHSNLKTNTMGNHSAKQAKRYGLHRIIGKYLSVL